MIATADWAPLEWRVSGQAGPTWLVRMQAIHAVDRSPDPEQIDGHGQPERTFGHRAGSMTQIP